MPFSPGTSFNGFYTRSPGRRGDVTVFEHPSAGFCRATLIGPHTYATDTLNPNSSLACSHDLRQRSLEDLTLPSVLGTYPVGKLGDNDGSRVTAVLFLLQPAITRASP